jgi:hypothetical protein
MQPALNGAPAERHVESRVSEHITLRRSFLVGILSLVYRHDASPIRAAWPKLVYLVLNNPVFRAAF